jgi:uncharacterized protein YnzC (UPF0291/DUF896 family)
MRLPETSLGLDRLVQPLSDCLTPESARRLVGLKPDPRLQARVDELSAKSSAGTLTDHEREEYARYVSFGTFVAILKAKARLQLRKTRTRS